MTISAPAIVASVALTVIVSVATTLDVSNYLSAPKPAVVAACAAPPPAPKNDLQQAAEDLVKMTQGKVTQRL